jgi:hypothetical protein
MPVHRVQANRKTTLPIAVLAMIETIFFLTFAELFVATSGDSELATTNLAFIYLKGLFSLTEVELQQWASLPSSCLNSDQYCGDFSDADYRLQFGCLTQIFC